MMAKGCVKQDELKEFLSTVRDNDWPEDINEKFIFETFHKINSKLNHYHMMIRSYLDEVTAQKYYVFISKVDNDVTRAASHYGPKQFEFFKLVLKEITTNPQAAISRSSLKQLAAKAYLTDFNNLVVEWLEKDWLISLGDESLLTLGPRSMAELDVMIPNFQEVSQVIVATRKTHTVGRPRQNPHDSGSSDQD